LRAVLSRLLEATGDPLQAVAVIAGDCTDVFRRTSKRLDQGEGEAAEGCRRWGLFLAAWGRTLGMDPLSPVAGVASSLNRARRPD
jgi:hypothetical protein